MKIDGPYENVFEALGVPRNEDMPAGSPMVFSCRQCGRPIWVPECYVVKPALCPTCGGEWSGDVSDPGVEVPT